MAATDEREAGHTVQEREELTPRKRDPLEEQCLRDPNEGTARFQVIDVCIDTQLHPSLMYASFVAY
jgi:hypothetical protein